MKNNVIRGFLVGGTVLFGSFFDRDASAQSFWVVPGTQSGTGFVSPLDNPVFHGQITLAPLEQSHRTPENNWEYTRFELQMFTTCMANDPFCLSTDTRTDPGVLNVWPEVAGGWTEGQSLTVEAHGLAVGHSAATIRLDKNARVGNSMVYSTLGTTSVALSPDTHLLPVNVVVILPAASIDPYRRGTMEGIYSDVRRWRALFDDLWSPNLFRITEPDALLNQIQGTWNLRPTPSTSDGQGFTQVGAFVRPDDIFAQCGIQFRLASVTTIDETDPRKVWFTDNGQPNGAGLCNSGSGFTLRSWYNSWRATALQSPTQILYGDFNQNGITVIVSPQIDGDQNCLGSLQGATDAGTKTVTLAVMTSHVGNYRLTMSHELGHVLGMDHPPEPCSNNLMCAGGADTTAHIPGCDLRNGVPASPLPYNCAPILGESIPAVASCDLARSKAGPVETASAVPIPMEPAGMLPGGGAGTPGWQWSGGLVPFETGLFIEGTASLRVPGQGWRLINSPPFRTADWFKIGKKLAFDLYPQKTQPLPPWLGGIDVFVNIPSAGINNVSIGHRELSEFPVDQWSTAEFNVPDSVREAFLGDYAGASLSIAVNTPSGLAPLYLDALRFTGNVTERTEFHRGPLDGGSTNPLFGFEAVSNWSAPTGTLRSVFGTSTEGDASLGILGAGYTEIFSRGFNTSELLGVTDDLSLDVYVPAGQPNPYWVGAIDLYVSCPAAGVHNQYLGYADLTPLFQNEFNTVDFPVLPSNVLSAFQTPGTACALKFGLNVNTGSGEYFLDNLAFR